MTSDSMVLKVYDPTGASDTTLLHAPRLDTLEGKTICELSNADWEYKRIFPVVRELLQKRFPTTKIVPHSEVLSSRTEIEYLERVSKVVKEKGCQAIIAGNAG